MSVYDSASKLSNEIKNSKEYKDFVYNMKVIKNNKNDEKLLEEYKITQYNLQCLTMNNKKIDKKSMKRMEDIQSKVRNNKNIHKYLLAEEKFNLMMEKINKIIAQDVAQDYK